MKLNKWIIITASGLCFASCKSVYSTYERPSDVKADSLLRDTPVNDNDSDIKILSWRELFQDAHLVELIESGLQNNADIHTARLKTEEAKATLSASKKAFLPSLSFAPQGQISSFDGDKANKTYPFDLSSDWEVDAFGSLRNQKKQSEMSLAESETYTQAVQTQLIATIAESYYTLEMLDREYQITEETVKTWEEYVHSLKVLWENSSTTSAALEQNEASLLSARHSMLALQQQIHEQENALSTLVGNPAGSIDRGNIDDHGVSQTEFNIQCSMLSNRPDVRRKEYQLAQCFYGVNAARSAFYPNITLKGSAGWTNSNGGMIVNPGKILLSAVGSITQPIFNKGKNTANLKIAQAQYDEAKIAFSQSLLDAGEEANNALTAWQTAVKKQAIDKQQTAKLEKALNSTQLLMENGSSTTYLDVLTARQSLLSSIITEIEDKYSEIESIVKLYHSIGGGIW